MKNNNKIVKNMITPEDYRKARNVIEQYEKQLDISVVISSIIFLIRLLYGLSLLPFGLLIYFIIYRDEELVQVKIDKHSNFLTKWLIKK
jgi:hypothetical protein